MPGNPRVWGIIPAAGRGQRFGTDRPKQYQPLAGITVIERAIAAVLNHPLVEGIVIALANDDQYFDRLQLAVEKSVHTVVGGATRSASVQQALAFLQDKIESDEWVLVHDAARPCLGEADLNRLIEGLYRDPVGGILACPVTDTLKQANDHHRIVRTLDRENLWRALTPQMFRLGLLTGAMERASSVTDEAGAMEQAGHAVQLVQGRADNIKITTPEDLVLAKNILKTRD